MPITISLDNLLTQANRAAVGVAAEQGPAVLPAIERAATSRNMPTRQLAMTCAGRIPGPQSGHILAAGLLDPNLNVALEAANILSANPPAEAAKAILARLAAEPDDRIREPLAMAAGYLPGDATMATLAPIAAGTGFVAVAARMALAKLDDPAARASLLSELMSPLAHTRYDALGWLRYIDDPKLAPNARKLLADRAAAVRVGTLRQNRFRRVCDQAVDTLVYLLKLKPPFETSVEKIYADQELAAIGQMSG